MRETAYDDRFFPVCKADIADRIRGHTARANARLGFLSPPAGDGRIFWVKANADREAVWLAAELAHALRACRQDVRLVVTFEEEDAVSSARLAQLPRAGFGYGPADWPVVCRRVLRRFDALAGVVAVGNGLRPRLAKLLAERRIPAAIIHGMPSTEVEALGLPCVRAEAKAWGEAKLACAPLASMIVEAQVEPHLRGVAGPGARAVWWIADADKSILTACVRQWRESKLAATDILFVGGPCNDVPRLSQWDRTAFPVGSVIAVDDPRYWSALSASCDAIHLDRPPERLLWQVLAGGRIVSVKEPSTLDLLDPAPVAVVDCAHLFDFWDGLMADPVAARARADEIRRYFWRQRRNAEAALSAWLSQVYAW